MKNQAQNYTELWTDLGNYYAVIEGFAEGDKVLKKGGGGGGAPGGAGGGGRGGMAIPKGKAPAPTPMVQNQ